MLIGVVSDTHDCLPAIDAALSLFRRRRVRAVVHAGDVVAPFALRRLLRFGGPVHAIFGNCDGERAGLEELMPQIQEGPLLIKLGECNALIHHFIDWCRPGDITQADVVITGHTHKVCNRVENGKLYLNPGECCGWISGRCTVAILDTSGPSAEVCELELRR